VPFLSTKPSLRIECTATPPSASTMGTAPNFMGLPRPDAAAP
jgi:hypothetical protein